MSLSPTHWDASVRPLMVSFLMMLFLPGESEVWKFEQWILDTCQSICGEPFLVMESINLCALSSVLNPVDDAAQADEEQTAGLWVITSLGPEFCQARG